MAEVQPVSIVILDEETEAQVRVKQKNRDQFFLSLGEAVAACAAFVKSSKYFTSQVADLLEVLSNWVKARKDRIRSANLTFRLDNSVLFVITQKGVAFDEELSKDLTELDIAIANDEAYDLIHLDVLAIPAVSRDSANAFLSSGQVFTHA